MLENTHKIKEKIANVLELPKDIILDITKIIITGKDSVVIENHNGIISYSESKISINSGDGILTIKGKDLTIKSIVEEEISIKGKINAIDL